MTHKFIQTKTWKLGGKVHPQTKKKHIMIAVSCIRWRRKNVEKLVLTNKKRLNCEFNKKKILFWFDFFLKKKPSKI